VRWTLEKVQQKAGGTLTEYTEYVIKFYVQPF